MPQEFKHKLHSMESTTCNPATRGLRKHLLLPSRQKCLWNSQASILFPSCAVGMRIGRGTVLDSLIHTLLRKWFLVRYPNSYNTDPCILRDNSSKNWSVFVLRAENVGYGSQCETSILNENPWNQIYRHQHNINDTFSLQTEEELFSLKKKLKESLMCAIDSILLLFSPQIKVTYNDNTDKWYT